MASELTYPVKVEAKLSEDLSRWLWLVKWLLVIPHYFVLAFLWLAFFVMSVAAFFAILFTGRYPRGIFDFNVGVLRWTWRVSYYSYGALGTDRYPPFTLDEDPDYPAHLDVAYPDKLSRGLVLVKWWLLAIPHYIIVGLLVGGTWLAFRDNWEVMGFGLIGVLTLVAGVALAFTGRYPTQLFDFLLGLNRWVIRVAAYAGLMTDAYPPFRLDAGGGEPGAVTMPPPPGTGAATKTPPPTAEATSGSSATSSRWTAGPIFAVVFGSFFAITSFGLLAGGGVALWADGTQREDGFVTTPAVDLSTGAYAVVADDIEIHADGPDWILPRAILGDARVTVSSETPIFVGIGRSADVERYLEGVSYSVVPNLAERDGLDLPRRDGGEPASPPTDRSFWIASAHGGGTESITWPVSNGDWSIVVMNSDGSSDVAFEGKVGAEVPVLGPIAIGLLVAGAVLLVVGITLIRAGVVRAGRRNG